MAFNNNSPIGNMPGGGDYAIGRGPVSAVGINAVMRLVYVWMGLGLAVTAVISAYITPQIVSALEVVRTTGVFPDSIWANPAVLIGAIIAELVLVIALSFGLTRKWLSPTLAAVLFMVYAALNGLTISWVVAQYTPGTVVKAFASTAVLFGAMSIYGYTTKSDLTSWGKYLLMGLIGLIVAMVINMLFPSGPFDLIISIFGVFLFVALTAYDTNRIKAMTEDPELQRDGNLVLKFGIWGALRLYLDFINLFLYLLRLFGRSER